MHVEASRSDAVEACHCAGKWAASRLGSPNPRGDVTKMSALQMEFGRSSRTSPLGVGP